MAELKKVAFVFPGQGSQFVGMGLDLYLDSPAAKRVFEEVDQIMRFPISRLCFEGPEEELRQTVNAQPAVFLVSIACLRAVQEVSKDGFIPPVFVAGHSLGEYTALVAAGALKLSQALYLVRERGRLMHEAGKVKSGGMIAVLGLDQGLVAEICAVTNTSVANINCPGQIVISGSEENLALATKEAQAKGARRVLPLKVSGAFHSPLMQPALEGLAKAIDSVSFRHPEVPIIANTTAQPLKTAEEIKEELAKQLCHCVQWQSSIEYMVACGVSTFIEIGPGEVLTGLTKRIAPQARTLNISDMKSIESAIEALKA